MCQTKKYIQTKQQGTNETKEDNTKSKSDESLNYTPQIIAPHKTFFPMTQVIDMYLSMPSMPSLPVTVDSNLPCDMGSSNHSQEKNQDEKNDFNLNESRFEETDAIKPVIRLPAANSFVKNNKKNKKHMKVK